MLLDAALDLPPAERVAWVETLDHTHDELKPRLRALLARAAEIESRDFLGSLPAIEGPDDEPAGPQTPVAAGGRVGPYQLQRQLGAGGMGTVWLATRADGLFERSIALKLPHRGMFGADLAERMARERGILAGLDHPNIARLYDAGLTDDGQPYLALEYVEGVAVDEYCRRRDCDLRERLRLFLQVADAVASAHARLVVHRDLKPANILVANDGNVRLLDFGIAKLLDAPAAGGAPLTQLSVHAMTPDYASPEQILGEPVTIASDVYSLGVVLFELLTGERPYRLRRDTRGALEDAIVQCEPRRPSELPVAHARALRGDLDTIVLKALRKQPGERYSTVNALADDLRRHLDGRPVTARPDSTWYRASRFLRRNRYAVAAGAVVAMALVVGAVSATLGFVRARAAESRALAEAETSRQVARFMVELFKVSDPGEARGNSVTAREILDRASARISSGLDAAPSVRVELLATMADVYSKLGLYAEALSHARSALQLYRTKSDPRKLADALDQVGENLSLLRRGPDAVPLHSEALALRRGLAPRDHAAIAATLRHSAVAHYAQGNFDVAMPLLLEARRELGLASPADQKQLGELLKYIANLHHEKGDYEHAVPVYREALSVARTALGEDHPLVAGTLGDLAVALKDTQQFEEAEKAYRESLAIQRRVLGAGHPDVGNGLNNLAAMYLDRGRFDEALATAQEGTDILRAALGEDHNLTNIARLNSARAHTQLGHLDVAESEYRVILAIRRRTLGAEDMALPLTMEALADVLNRKRKFVDAEAQAREARAGMERTVGRDHWRWAAASRTLGTALTGQKQFPEAERVLLESYDIMSRKRGPAHRTTLLTAQRLADLYEAWKRPTEAKIWQVRSTPAAQ
jgi:serine/threonine protein kinase